MTFHATSTKCSCSFERSTFITPLTTFTYCTQERLQRPTALKVSYSAGLQCLQGCPSLAMMQLPQFEQWRLPAGAHTPHTAQWLRVLPLTTWPLQNENMLPA